VARDAGVIIATVQSGDIIRGTSSVEKERERVISKTRLSNTRCSSTFAYVIDGDEL
jgi:hypothetical protein